MKTKTKITLGIIAFLLLTTGAVLCILHNQGFFFDKSPIYGTFEYKNEDGSIAKVVLTESTVYCENVDYEWAMSNAVIDMINDHFDEIKKEDPNAKTDMEEFDRLREEYLKELDFKSAYDGKTSKIDITNYYEDELGHLYLYEVKYPETGSHGLEFSVDLETKTLCIADMEFEYVGE